MTEAVRLERLKNIGSSLPPLFPPPPPHPHLPFIILHPGTQACSSWLCAKPLQGGSQMLRCWWCSKGVQKGPEEWGECLSFLLWPIHLLSHVRGTQGAVSVVPALQGLSGTVFSLHIPWRIVSHALAPKCICKPWVKEESSCWRSSLCYSCKRYLNCFCWKALSP
jgi:hypothetical protein